MSNGAPFDVFMTGPLFFDLVFTGLPSAPEPGTEIFTEGMGSLPGGIANLAVATARLGLDSHPHAVLFSCRRFKQTGARYLGAKDLAHV